jgi:hypothetical protein
MLCSAAAASAAIARASASIPRLAERAEHEVLTAANWLSRTRDRTSYDHAS